ncbi:MAG: NusA-like transcription termination signal-binding factor [Candidatus Hydrothermarchaeales archaeon]
MAVKLTADELGYITVFERMTGAVTKDCIIDEDENKIVFVVKEGDMGLAIGRKGVNVQRVGKTIGKRIEVIEHSEDPAKFVKNLLRPLRIKEVSVSDGEDRKIARVDVDVRDKIRAIGRRGKNVQKIRELAQRHCGINDVIIS